MRQAACVLAVAVLWIAGCDSDVEKNDEQKTQQVWILPFSQQCVLGKFK